VSLGEGFSVNQYLGIIALLGAASSFLFVMLFLAIKLGPQAITNTKLLPFECGSVSVGQVSEQRFNVKFYLMAMLFIVFDIEVIFMYPWALVLRELGWPGFIMMTSFIAVLTVGLVYVWRKGVLDWNRS
jgi:NADH-quinone oxidoreductase subunit A